MSTDSSRKVLLALAVGAVLLRAAPAHSGNFAVNPVVQARSVPLLGPIVSHVDHSGGFASNGDLTANGNATFTDISATAGRASINGFVRTARIFSRMPAVFVMPITPQSPALPL